jgi:hypothetical protein
MVRCEKLMIVSETLLVALTDDCGHCLAITPADTPVAARRVEKNLKCMLDDGGLTQLKE